MYAVVDPLVASRFGIGASGRHPVLHFVIDFERIGLFQVSCLTSLGR